MFLACSSNARSPNIPTQQQGMCLPYASGLNSGGSSAAFLSTLSSLACLVNLMLSTQRDSASPTTVPSTPCIQALAYLQSNASAACKVW